MRRFFISRDSISGQRASIRGSNVHHIRNVLRLSGGDRVIVIDESAAEHVIEIETINNDLVTGRIISGSNPTAPPVFLTLFQGLPKGTKLDDIVEKATELGADQITPVIMKRSIARPGTAGGTRIERFRRIAEAAAKQCRRPSLPQIDPTLTWPGMLAAIPDFDLVVVFWEEAGTPANKVFAGFKGKRLAIVIGPEGGLTTEEIKTLTSAGAETASLGPRILRTETAPIAALAIVNHILKR